MLSFHPFKESKIKIRRGLNLTIDFAKQTDDGECADVNECDTGAHNCLESQRSLLILIDRRE